MGVNEFNEVLWSWSNLKVMSCQLMNIFKDPIFLTRFQSFIYFLPFIILIFINKWKSIIDEDLCQIIPIGPNHFWQSLPISRRKSGKVSIWLPIFSGSITFDKVAFVAFAGHQAASTYQKFPFKDPSILLWIEILFFLRILTLKKISLEHRRLIYGQQFT